MIRLGDDVSFMFSETSLQHGFTDLINLCRSVQQMHPAKRKCVIAVFIFHFNAQINSRIRVDPYDVVNAAKSEYSTVFDKQILSAKPELVVLKGLCKGEVAVQSLPTVCGKVGV